MSKAQLEQGYTPFANKLLEAILRGKWTNYEMKVILAVARSTYGWSRKESSLSSGDISRLTGIDRAHVKRELKKLIRDCVISSRAGSRAGSENILGLNPDFSSWKGRFRSVDKLEPLQAPLNGTGGASTGPTMEPLQAPLNGMSGASTGPTCGASTGPTIKQENNRFLNQAIKQDTARLVDKLSNEKSFNGQTVKIAAVLKGREAELKAGANPAALVDSICQVSKFERSRVWAYVVQSRKANNPSGWLVNVLANGRYTPADWAAEEASNERRRFQD